MADNVASGTVREVVYLGDAIKYALEIDGGTALTVRWPYRPSSKPLDVGARVQVGWSADLVHVVDWD